jgi:hypothetical protein
MSSPEWIWLFWSPTRELGANHVGQLVKLTLAAEGSCIAEAGHATKDFLNWRTGFEAKASRDKKGTGLKTHRYKPEARKSRIDKTQMLLEKRDSSLRRLRWYDGAGDGKDRKALA